MSQQPQLIVGGYPQQPAYLVTSPVQATYMPHQQYPQQVPYGNNNFYQNNAAYGQPQPAFQPYTDAAGFASPVAVHVSVPVADNVQVVELVNTGRSVVAQVFLTLFFPVFIGVAIFMATYVGGRTGNLLFSIIPSIMAVFGLVLFIVVSRRLYRGVQRAAVHLQSSTLHVVHHGFLCVNPGWEEDINLRDVSSFTFRAETARRGTYWYLDLFMRDGEIKDFSIGESTGVLVQNTLERVRAVMRSLGIQEGGVY